MHYYPLIVKPYLLLWKFETYAFRDYHRIFSTIVYAWINNRVIECLIHKSAPDFSQEEKQLPGRTKDAEK